MPPRSPAAMLGEHLGRRRQALGLTVEDAADRAGLTAFGVRAVEAGRGWPKHPAAHLAALADALELPKRAVTLKLADDSVLRADVESRRLRGGLYGGPAKRLRGRVVTRAHGSEHRAPVSGPPRPLASRSATAPAPIEDTSVSSSTATPES